MTYVINPVAVSASPLAVGGRRTHHLKQNKPGTYVKSLGVFLNGATIPNPNPRGESVIDDKIYMIFNAYHEALNFILPGADYGTHWVKELDTENASLEEQESLKAWDKIKVEARSLVVLRQAS